jgi:tetratricopeptide (TPR) repeat protein
VAGGARVAIVGVSLAAFALLTNLRHPAWVDNMALWSTTVRDFPASWAGHHGYGTELQLHDRLREATAELERAVSLSPSSRFGMAILKADLGIVYAKQQLPDAAERSFRESLESKPLAKTYLNLGIALADSGRVDEAGEAFRQATDRDPLYARGWAMRAQWEQQQGNAALGQIYLARARSLSPHDVAVEKLSSGR